MVEGVERTGGRGDGREGGERGADGFHVGPVLEIFRPDGALVDPAAQQCDLGGGEALAFLRHHIVFVRCQDALDQETLCTRPGDQGGLAGFAAAEGVGERGEG